MFNAKMPVTLILLVMLILPSLSFAVVMQMAPTDKNLASQTKSYREWKSAKLAMIENKIKHLRDNLKAYPERVVSNAKDPNLLQRSKSVEAGLRTELQNQLDQEILNLSNSKDLTVTDYFVGYLTKQISLEVAIREVSAKMNPDEVAELMSAFAIHFFETRPPSHKSPPRAEHSR